MSYSLKQNRGCEPRHSLRQKFDPSLIPPPALGECCHRSLARRLIAVKGPQKPVAEAPYLGGDRLVSGWRRLPVKSDPTTSRVALAAVSKLAVEAGEQRRILIERDSRTGIDLQRVAPGARPVNRE